MLRDLGGAVVRAPDATRTTYDPAIAETDPRFGIEAALSEFDAQLQSSMFWEKNDRALNNEFFGGGTRILFQDASVFQAAITKTRRHRLAVHDPPQRRLRRQQRAGQPVPQRLEHQRRSGNPPAVAARHRRAVQPHRRAVLDAGRLQRRAHRAAQHRRRARRFRDRRPRPGEQRRERVLGFVLRLPRARRQGEGPRRRARRRGGASTRCTKRAAAAARRRRKPRPASSTSASSKTCRTR